MTERGEEKKRENAKKKKKAFSFERTAAAATDCHQQPASVRSNRDQQQRTASCAEETDLTFFYKTQCIKIL